jgi:hypothetical protein
VSALSVWCTGRESITRLFPKSEFLQPKLKSCHLKKVSPSGVILFPCSHYNYNYKLQFFDFWCWWLSPSSPEWVGITYAAYSSILHQMFCHKLMVASWSISYIVSLYMRPKSIIRTKGQNKNVCQSKSDILLHFSYRRLFKLSKWTFSSKWKSDRKNGANFCNGP